MTSKGHCKRAHIHEIRRWKAYIKFKWLIKKSVWRCSAFAWEGNTCFQETPYSMPAYVISFNNVGKQNRNRKGCFENRWILHKTQLQRFRDIECFFFRCKKNALTESVNWNICKQKEYQRKLGERLISIWTNTCRC